MSATVPSAVTSPPSTLDAVRAAIAWARRLGLFVRPAVTGHGVECTSQHVEFAPWVCAREVGNVDPVGACILQKQPETTDLDRAAADALGGSVPYSECFAAGLRGEDIPEGWRRSTAWLLGLHGWCDGQTMREELLSKKLHAVKDDDEPVTVDALAWTPDFEEAALRAGMTTPKAKA